MGRSSQVRFHLESLEAGHGIDRGGDSRPTDTVLFRIDGMKELQDLRGRPTRFVGVFCRFGLDIQTTSSVCKTSRDGELRTLHSRLNLSCRFHARSRCHSYQFAHLDSSS